MNGTIYDDLLEARQELASMPTGPWLEYPAHQPEEGKEYLVDTQFNEDSPIIRGIFTWKPGKSKRWEFVRRFAEIRG